MPALHPTPTSLVQGLLLALLPHGGQLTAQRNAWAGMVSDAQQARAWRESTAAVAAAHTRSASAGPAAAAGG